MIECPSCKAPLDTRTLSCDQCGSCVAEIDGFVAWAPELAHASSGFKAEYFKTLSELEESNFWFRGRNAIILWALQHYCPGFRNYLEVGCGTGYVLSAVAKTFPKSVLTGSEIFTDGLTFALARVPTAQFVQMDARKIPYRQEFDVVGSFDVLEHIEEDADVLLQMHEALRPGGMLVISVPQHPWLWSASDEYACHVRRYTKKELYNKVQAAGFEVVRSTSFVSLLLPAMLLTRKRSSDKARDPLDEFRLSPTLNRVLEGVLALDRKVIKMGIDLPVGGSRLLVARRPLE